LVAVVDITFITDRTAGADGNSAAGAAIEGRAWPATSGPFYLSVANVEGARSRGQGDDVTVVKRIGGIVKAARKKNRVSRIEAVCGNAEALKISRGGNHHGAGGSGSGLGLADDLNGAGELRAADRP